MGGCMSQSVDRKMKPGFSCSGWFRWPGKQAEQSAGEAEFSLRLFLLYRTCEKSLSTNSRQTLIHKMLALNRPWGVHLSREIPSGGFTSNESSQDSHVFVRDLDFVKLPPLWSIKELCYNIVSSISKGIQHDWNWKGCNYFLRWSKLPGNWDFAFLPLLSQEHLTTFLMSLRVHMTANSAPSPVYTTPQNFFLFGQSVPFSEQEIAGLTWFKCPWEESGLKGSRFKCQVTEILPLGKSFLSVKVVLAQCSASVFQIEG